MLADYGYGRHQRRSSIDYGNGADVGFAYTADNDLTNLNHAFASGPAARFAYGYDGAGNPLRRFVHARTLDENGQLVDDLLAMQDVASGDYSYVHQNRQGSTIAISNDSGLVPTGEEYKYESYGAPDHSGAFPFQYTGRRYDPETGFYYYRARMYDAELGRFLQVDPIGYEDQINLYAYVRNDPLNLVDPSGKVVVAIPAIWWLGAATVAVVCNQFCDDLHDNDGVTAGDSYLGDAVTSMMTGDDGDIYVVPGEDGGTPSGKDYVGSSDNLGKRGKRDGRDRDRAEVVDNYKKGDRKDRRRKEQQAINDRGGKESLDNRRNEVAEDKWKENDIDPPEEDR